MSAPGKAVRWVLTAALLSTVLLRLLRIWTSRESVAQFYRVDGPLWTLLEAALFLGPFLAALSAAGALWLRREKAAGLAAVNFCAAGFFTLYEALLLFARSMEGNSGYVGAEPLFSLFACAVSGGTVLRVLFSQRREWKRDHKNKDIKGK